MMKLTWETWDRITTRYPWEVRLHPGCYTSPDAPLISRHRTLAAAVRKARQSDRWRVETSRMGRVVWAAPERGDRRYGAGRYGNGPRPGEPSLAQCVRAAREAERYVARR